MLPRVERIANNSVLVRPVNPHHGQGRRFSHHHSYAKSDPFTTVLKTAVQKQRVSQTKTEKSEYIFF